MGSQKILTNEKYFYSDKEFQVYKTKKGCIRCYTEEVSCSSEAISMNLINE